MNKQELLNKYLDRSLSEEETIAFNELKKSDPEFNEKVIFHDDLAEVVLEDERRRLKSLLSDRKPIKTKSKRKFTRLLIIGLGLLLIIATIVTYLNEKRQNAPEAIYASYYEAFPNSYQPVSRNSLNNVSTQGFTAYEKGNYKLAEEKFEESIRENGDLSIIFYQGICYGEMNNLSLAIQKMEEIKGQDFPFSAEAYWYLGLYHLKQGNSDDASRNLLDYIRLSDNDEKKLDAREIISELNKL